MEKKSEKSSELERLHLEKMRLQKEADASLQRLDEQWDYLQSNIGSLLMGTVASTVKSKLPPPVQQVISSFESKDRKRISPHVSSLIDKALDFVPLFFKGIKPLAIVFALKKIKKLFLTKN